MLSLGGSVWAAPPGVQDVRERYFGADWAQVLEAPLPAPAAAVAAAPQPDNPIGAEHAQIAHMYITREAFKIFMAQHPDSDLAQYIGDYDYTTGRPKARDDGNVVAGSFDEDEFYDNPFGQKESYFRHFWNPYGGLHAGIAGFDSSVDRAYKYLTGGYGVDGKYDEQWDHNDGAKRGVKGHGAVWLYRHGEKAKAFWYLGHIAHLLEDATVPAHVHLFAHVIDWMDAYETYMKKAHSRWPSDPSLPIEHFDTLLDLFRATAVESARFDCGNGGGISGGVDGTADRGRRRAGGFTKAELDDEGNVLMPMAFERVAALYQLFYEQAAAPGGRP
jgi:hypothetical protein